MILSVGFVDEGKSEDEAVAASPLEISMLDSCARTRF
jgi:hypothetical protein